MGTLPVAQLGIRHTWCGNLLPRQNQPVSNPCLQKRRTKWEADYDVVLDEKYQNQGVLKLQQ